ncbi:hypothetical protein EON67_03235 [archaeon]|nr:MAG: hypothetical protein EON67_03235 [archaeon]
MQAEYCIAGAKRPCPYAGAVFLVTINYPEKYPFEAPTVRVRTCAHPTLAACFPVPRVTTA